MVDPIFIQIRENFDETSSQSHQIMTLRYPTARFRGSVAFQGDAEHDHEHGAPQQPHGEVQSDGYRRRAAVGGQG